MCCAKGLRRGKSKHVFYFLISRGQHGHNLWGGSLALPLWSIKRTHSDNKAVTECPGRDKPWIIDQRSADSPTPKSLWVTQVASELSSIPCQDSEEKPWEHRAKLSVEKMWGGHSGWGPKQGTRSPNAWSFWNSLQQPPPAQSSWQQETGRGREWGGGGCGE